MKVSIFKDKVDYIAGEIGCDGEGIASHNIPSRVSAYCEETDEYFDIVGMEVDQLMGCGCWAGIELQLKKSED